MWMQKTRRLRTKSNFGNGREPNPWIDRPVTETAEEPAFRVSLKSVKEPAHLQTQNETKAELGRLLAASEKVKVSKTPRGMFSLVKKAIVLRTEDGFDVSAKVKLPAAQLMANYLTYVTIPAAVGLTMLLTPWKKETQAVVGGTVGDLVGSVLGFAAAWFVLNPRFKTQGLKRYVDEITYLIRIQYTGLADKFNEAIKIRESQGDRMNKVLKKTIYALGVLASPAEVSYYMYGLAIYLTTKAGLHPLASTFASGFGLNALFIAYSNVLAGKKTTEIDASLSVAKERTNGVDQ